MDTVTTLEPSTSRNDLWQVTLTKSRVAAHLGVTTSWKKYCVRIETESYKYIIIWYLQRIKDANRSKEQRCFLNIITWPTPELRVPTGDFCTWKGGPADNKPSDDHCLAGLVCRRLQQPRRRATPSLTPCDALWSSTLSAGCDLECRDVMHWRTRRTEFDTKAHSSKTSSAGLNDYNYLSQIYHVMYH